MKKKTNKMLPYLQMALGFDSISSSNPSANKETKDRYQRERESLKKEAAEKFGIEDWKNIIVPAKRYLKEPHVISMQKAHTALATSKLTALELKVLHALIGACDFENYVHVTQQSIADLVGRPRSNVTSAIKVLAESGLICIMKKGNSNFYILNPDFLYKGRMKNYKKTKEEFQQALESQAIN